MKTPKGRRSQKSRVPLVRDTKTHGRYDNRVATELPAMMAYRTERLAIPKPSNKLRHEMLITAKERSIASKSQLKGHAHHYFVSPYRNSQPVAHCGAEVARELGSLSQLSHAEPMLALSTLSPLDTVQSKYGSETSRSLPADPNVHAHAHPGKDKLPAIVAMNQRKPAMRSQKDNSWLGPPNSIPPDKRREHVAAYKTMATNHSAHDAESVRPMEEQSESETISEVARPLLIDRFSNGAHYHGYDDDADSSVSLYPSEMSGSADSYSVASDTHFAQLRLIDKPLGRHFPSPGTSLQLKSLAASTRFDEASERYSNNAIMFHYGESLSDSQSNLSGHSRETRRKKVHFDPEVRDVSLENRSAPLVAHKHTQQHDDSSSNGVKISLDITPASDSAVDQLPAVVEKFMIKSLPVLPSINRSAINLNNANVIYIKDGGKRSVSGQDSDVTRPVFIAKNNVIDTSKPRAGAVTSQAASSSQGAGTRVHHHPHKALTAVPQLSRVAEESSNASSSPSPQLRHSNKATKPQSPQKVVPASTSAYNAQNPSQYSCATHTSNAQSTSSKAPVPKKVVSKKTLKPEPKKAASTKSKTRGRKGRSSGSSSRNSPSVDSPINDVSDDPEVRDQRQREYAAAMLAVQQRMREFDMRYGKSSTQPEQEDKDRSWFGKAIPPKSNLVPKPRITKQK